MKLIKYIRNPKIILIILLNSKFSRFLPDKFFIKLKFKLITNKKLDLANPQTFNEKLQWLKLNDRKEIYTNMVDKYDAKKYVSKILSEEYIIPTLGIYNNFEEINFNELPNKFVIKPTHTSGNIFICKDKSQINYKELRREVRKWLKRKYYYLHREWPYKNVKPRIIIEKYMEDSEDGELRDYKFFCFNGKVKLMFIATNRQGKGDTYFDFFDEEFNHLSIKNGHPNSPITPHKPNNFEKMKDLAEKLSADIPHLRIDFYEINGKIYFGEMTFFHWSGLVPFEPEEWDKKLGDMLELPKEKIIEKNEK